MFSFLGMAIFDDNTIRLSGISFTMILLFASVLNLTFTPALLLAFPNFFGSFQYLPFCFKSVSFDYESKSEDYDGSDLDLEDELVCSVDSLALSDFFSVRHRRAYEFLHQQ